MQREIYIYLLYICIYISLYTHLSFYIYMYILLCTYRDRDRKRGILLVTQAVLVLIRTISGSALEETTWSWIGDPMYARHVLSDFKLSSGPREIFKELSNIIVSTSKFKFYMLEIQERSWWYILWDGLQLIEYHQHFLLTDSTIYLIKKLIY